MKEAVMDSDLPDPNGPRHRWEPAHVECCSGYRDEETPRAVFLGGIRFPVAEVLSRQRVRDSRTGLTTETFQCRLEAGWPVSLERSEDGSWRVRRSASFFCGGNK
jgi:hypothetical protein